MHRLHPGIRKTSVQIREVAASKEQKGMVMKKEEMNTVGTEQQTNTVSNTVVCVVVVAAVLVFNCIGALSP